MFWRTEKGAAGLAVERTDVLTSRERTLMSNVDKIIIREISELKPLEYNPRQLTVHEYAGLKASLERFGMIDPVIVNKHPERLDNIVGGHARVRVWKDLGNSTVPTVEIYLEEEEEREACIRLNRNVGSWDFDALANKFDSDALLSWGFEPFEFGMDTHMGAIAATAEQSGADAIHGTSSKGVTCPSCGTSFQP